MKQPKIIYTKTDEAPALATYSLFPIAKKFIEPSDIEVEMRDISLAARILAQFPENLTEQQRVDDALSELGEWAKTPDANIIKLPNISASIPQLQAAICELQKQDYKIPDFPENPQNEQEREIATRYAKVLGSAVNPVLREGNSDRRVALAVKEYARKNPHNMGKWFPNSTSHVASMQEGDFYASEASVIVEKAQNLKIELLTKGGEKITLRESVPVLDHEVIDSSYMSMRALRSYLKTEIQDAYSKKILLSLHLKATMMKISDPIIFGEAVKVYFSEVFEEFSDLFEKIGIQARDGMGSLYQKIGDLKPEQKVKILNAIEENYKTRPALAMVDSSKGITNLHVPSDIIIDASLPAMIRNAGKMWGPDGQLCDTKALIPDRSYARIYQATLDFCKEHGTFNPKSMGSVSNIGLMAQKAQEYGSHDKTFQIQSSGTVRVLDQNNQILIKHEVEAGDIWRMCQTKNKAIENWIQLGIKRAQTTGHPAVFWLDSQRAHDANLIAKVQACLDSNPQEEVHIMPPEKACHYTLERIKQGKDTISITGNVLRDYLTDLFPILELGTSAKMLSIVPLLAGGGLFETGAGGTAPKHVQQFLKENHLRWDSLGEFLALAVSLENLAEKTGVQEIKILAQTLEKANCQYLNCNKAPSPRSGELDNRGGHFYLAMYWAQALTQQSDSPKLKEKFQGLATQLQQQEKQIVRELNSVQGRSIDIGGYYHPDELKLSNLMRPSQLFNNIIDKF